MRFEPLDIFKVLPVIASGIASDGIGRLLNPIIYTTEQHYTYLVVGGVIGGLWSISLLGGFAEKGNKQSLIRWAVPLALAWALDAQIVRDKIIDTTNPHYTEYKKEYAMLPKQKDLAKIKEKISDYDSKIKVEESNNAIKNRLNLKKHKQEALSIYLSNYRKYGWWKSEASKIGCSLSVGLNDNQAERQRRVNCISSYLSTKTDISSLLTLKAKRDSLIIKQNSISNINSSSIAKERNLLNKIHNLESKTFPMWVYYVVMFFFGWFMESIFPHLKYWKDWSNEKAEKENKTVGSLSRENDEKRNQLMLEKVDDILSTKNEMIEFLKLHIQDGKMNQKYNTFFSVLRAIRAGEKDLKIDTVQKYSVFSNPKEKKPFNVKRYTVQVRKEFAKYKNLDTSNLAKILKNI